MVVMSSKGTSLPLKQTDQGDRTYKVEFTAPVAGPYNANVQFASKPVPSSPFKITVQASVNASQVYVKDLPECTLSLTLTIFFQLGVIIFLRFLKLNFYFIIIRIIFLIFAFTFLSLEGVLVL